MIIPNIWKNKNMFPHHQPVLHTCGFFQEPMRKLASASASSNNSDQRSQHNSIMGFQSPQHPMPSMHSVLIYILQVLIIDVGKKQGHILCIHHAWMIRFPSHWRWGNHLAAFFLRSNNLKDGCFGNDHEWSIFLIHPSSLKVMLTLCQSSIICLRMLQPYSMGFISYAYEAHLLTNYSNFLNSPNHIFDAETPRYKRRNQ